MNLLLTDRNGSVCGVVCTSAGFIFHEHEPVISATGGFGVQLTPDPLRSKHRLPVALPATSGDHSTGKSLKKCMGLGPERSDFEWVQVHPTSTVHPSGQRQR